MAEKKGPSNIDDLISEINGHGLKDDKKKIDAFAKFVSEENIDNIYFKHVKPAVDKAYEAGHKKIDSITKGDGKAKFDKDKKEEHIRGVLVDYMKEFFKNTSPSVLEAVKEIKDEKELYTVLANHMDSHYGVEDHSFQKWLDVLKKDKKLTGDKLRRNLEDISNKQKTSITSRLVGAAHMHYITGTAPGKVAAHIMSEAKKKGYEFEDDAEKAKYLSTPFHDPRTADSLIKVFRAYDDKKHGSAYEALGMKKKDDKK